MAKVIIEECGLVTLLAFSEMGTILDFAGCV